MLKLKCVILFVLYFLGFLDLNVVWFIHVCAFVKSHYDFSFKFVFTLGVC